MTQQLTIEQLKFARSIGATHYDWKDSRFRKDGYYWVEGQKKWRYGFDEDDFITFEEIQHIDFSPLEYTPKVGEWCISPGGAKVFYVGKGSTGGNIFQLENGGLTYFDDPNGFRPLPDPEQQRRNELLEAWKRQSLDNAHDTEASVLTVGEMIDFIVELEAE